MNPKNKNILFRQTVAIIALTALASACGEGSGGSSRKTVGGSSGTTDGEFEELDLAICSPQAGPFTLEIDNPYFPLPVGRQLVLEGEDEGEHVRVVVTVLKSTEVVAGVTTRVVEEHESLNGSIVEISRNFYAQAPDGTVCYFGEDVDHYEEGVITGNEGSWRAGEGENQPGIIMPGDPRPRTQFSQESAPGVAEDKSAILAVGAIEVPGDGFEDALHAQDWNPLEGQTREEGDDKFYARGVGLVVDGPATLTSDVPGATPTPSPTASPTPTPAPSPSPSATPLPTPTPSPTPESPARLQSRY